MGGGGGGRKEGGGGIRGGGGIGVGGGYPLTHLAVSLAPATHETTAAAATNPAPALVSIVLRCCPLCCVRAFDSAPRAVFAPKTVPSTPAEEAVFERAVFKGGVFEAVFEGALFEAVFKGGVFEVVFKGALFEAAFKGAFFKGAFFKGAMALSPRSTQLILSQSNSRSLLSVATAVAAAAAAAAASPASRPLETRVGRRGIGERAGIGGRPN